jgi:hypothetical protein
MNKIVIEDNIPQEPQLKSGTVQHALCTMEINQSFFVEGWSHNTARANITQAKRRNPKMLGKKFKCQERVEGEKKGIRTWRTE